MAPVLNGARPALRSRCGGESGTDSLQEFGFENPGRTGWDRYWIASVVPVRHQERRGSVGANVNLRGALAGGGGENGDGHRSGAAVARAPSGLPRLRNQTDRARAQRVDAILSHLGFAQRGRLESQETALPIDHFDVQ